MLRTLWGDDERFKDTYWSRFAEQGFYFAGDGAKKDDDGDIWLLGRVDDVMNVSGHRLSTTEIESALVSHPKVAEAAVVGAADETTGQAVCAFVILRESALERRRRPTIVEELRKHVQKEIGAIAKPRQIMIVPELPKTRSGKIMRRLLKDVAEHREVGDVTTLADSTVMDLIKDKEGSAVRGRLTAGLALGSPGRSDPGRLGGPSTGVDVGRPRASRQRRPVAEQQRAPTTRRPGRDQDRRPWPRRSARSAPGNDSPAMNSDTVKPMPADRADARRPSATVVRSGSRPSPSCTAMNDASRMPTGLPTTSPATMPSATGEVSASPSAATERDAGVGQREDRQHDVRRHGCSAVCSRSTIGTDSLSRNRSRLSSSGSRWRSRSASLGVAAGDVLVEQRRRRGEQADRDAGQRGVDADSSIANHTTTPSTT